MGFNEELFTLALKPINNTMTPELMMSKTNAGSKDSEVVMDLTSTNTEDEEMKEKMTTKTKQIVVGSMVALALGVVIFIVIKNRK